MPVAIVATIDGRAWANEPGHEKRDVRLFDWFAPETSLSTDENATVVLVFQGGTRVQVEGNSDVRITSTGAIASTGTVRRLSPVPPLPVLSPATLAGPATRINAVRVRGGGVLRMHPDEATVRASAARLEFEPVREARSYRVMVEGEDASTVFEATVAQTSVDVPDGVLAPGTQYHWRVIARDPLGRTSQRTVRFATLTRDQEVRRQALRDHLRGSAADLAFLAEIDRALGLLQEARAGFEQVHGDSGRPMPVVMRLRELNDLLPPAR